VAEPFETWISEDRAEKWRAAKLFAWWTAGWAIRNFAMGFLIGLGAWVGFAVVGTKIVCQ